MSSDPHRLRPSLQYTQDKNSISSEHSGYRDKKRNLLCPSTSLNQIPKQDATCRLLPSQYATCCSQHKFKVGGSYKSWNALA